MKLVDLFCGCGGFSLGAHQAGFDVAAAFDLDPILTSSFQRNFPATQLHLRNVAGLRASDVAGAVHGKISGVFGGPPCQGFSEIGLQSKGDPRRRLIAHFFRMVSDINPAFFVMENVRGLAFDSARYVLERALERVRDRFYIFGPTILDAADFGAATRRQRLFVIGINKDSGDPLTEHDIENQYLPPVTVRTAIADLESAEYVGEEDDFDVWRITKLGRPSEYARRLRKSDRKFTGHRPTMHTAAVIKRFRKVEQGKADPVGRHQRLDWSGQCPTLRAGTGSDRGSFQSVRPLHPSEPRVITVREAARLQGFPDAHQFHPTVWHSFRMIGNSVSPVMSKAVFEAVRSKLGYGRHLSIAAE